MSEDTPDSRSRPGGAEEIIGKATDEARLAQDRARAVAAAASAAAATKRRVVAGALAVAVLVLAAVLSVNLLDVSLAELFTADPPPEVARRQTQDALEAMVEGIEGFREDYAELPESLAEVASSSPGTWTYSRTPGGGYRVVLERHGQIATFDSAQSPKVVDAPHP
jgi:hypothetical protein